VRDLQRAGFFFAYASFDCRRDTIEPRPLREILLRWGYESVTQITGDYWRGNRGPDSVHDVTLPDPRSDTMGIPGALDV
jgi:hypothetical protein